MPSSTNDSDLDPRFALAARTSPYSAIRRDEGKYGQILVRFAGAPKPPRRDFDVRWTQAPGATPTAASFFE